MDSTSHLHTLYCKRFVRLRVLFKTHNTTNTKEPDAVGPYAVGPNAGEPNAMELDAGPEV
jgi:hypothetical protein